MRLATFVIHEQEQFGLVLPHPQTGEDWVFNPKLVESQLQLYASRSTSPLAATHPAFMGDAWPDDLTGFLTVGDAGMSALRRLADFLRRFLEQSDQQILLGTGWPLHEVKLRAPIPHPRLFFGLVQNSPTVWRHVPARTHLNVFPQGHQRPQGSVLGPGDPIILPPGDPILGGWNPELGVIIGKGGRDIPVSDAMAHVAGLTIVSDVTFDYYRKMLFAQPEPQDWFEDATTSWGDKKADARCPIGPYLVTMDEIGNPYDLLIYTRQSGWLRDRSHTGAMHIGIERTINWLSSFRTLLPGDVIHMGTMGYDGSIFLDKPAPTVDDYLESEIEKIGILRNPIVFVDSPDDWREPDDVTRRIHPAPAVRDVIAQKHTQLSEWKVAEARHFWMSFANHQGTDLPIRPYPRFLNTPTTALAAAGHEVYVPPRAHALSLGCELACVVGKLATNISEADAPDYILGYTVMAAVQDSSFADAVIEPASLQERHLPAVYARWADGFNVVSEALIQLPSDAITGRSCQLAVEGFGEVGGNTEEYIFSAPQLLAFISRHITLFPGDVITLGQLANTLTIPANTRIALGTTGYAEISGMQRVAFTLRDERIMDGG